MPESPLQHNSPTPSHLSSNMSPPDTQLEQDKRVRREIANSNERRRMQSINTGFQGLKILIPHSCGEKLSKACILQRAADHIKSLENEKLKLQSQNEQFRILIKSFQIDSTSVLQGKRRLSTDEFVDDRQTSFWHAQYIPTTDEKFYSTLTQPATSDTTYMIVKQNQPSQRCYKTNSLDQNDETNSNNIVIVERCQVRSQSLDTNVSKRNLQTIVEAIRHLEGDDVLSAMTNTSTTQQEELPAQLKAMINERFQKTPPSTANATTNDIDLHQRPPKKRKITFNEQLSNDGSPISN